MTREYIPVDISNGPELKRLAEAVRQSGKPHALTDGVETVAVVPPVPQRSGRRPRRSPPWRRSQPSLTADSAVA